MTHKQAIRLQVLIEHAVQRAVDLYAARQRSEEANAELADYVESLKQAPKEA